MGATGLSLLNNYKAKGQIINSAYFPVFFL